MPVQWPLQATGEGKLAEIHLECFSSGKNPSGGFLKLVELKELHNTMINTRLPTRHRKCVDNSGFSNLQMSQNSDYPGVKQVIKASHKV